MILFGTIFTVVWSSRKAAAETARERWRASHATTQSSATAMLFGGGTTTASTPNVQPMLSAGPTPHLTRAMSPPSFPAPYPGARVAIDYVKDP